MQENDDDDEIGALGSILSWDEEEEGVEGAVGSGSDREIGSSALPDLVSFNLKEGGLVQIPGVNGGEATNLTIPMPTTINFRQAQITTADTQHLAQCKEI